MKKTTALVLDPDLIDLTMIPPPMTPDEDGIYRVFPGAASAVSTPPTPFADRESLEAELKALEKDLGDIQQIKMTLMVWQRCTNLETLTHSSQRSQYPLPQKP